MPESHYYFTVGARLRPLVAHERGQKPCFQFSNNVITVLPEALDNDPGARTYKFDHAMDSSDASSPNYVSNERCYELIGKPMLDRALQGYNVCVLCYGQTGTGKTSTMLGDEILGKGLMVYFLEDLFDETEKMRSQGHEVELQLRMLEVYNETINDLLVLKENSDGRSPSSKENSENRSKVEAHVLPGGVHITGAETIGVVTLAECMRYIEFGNGNKVVAATEMNSQSSRGHTIINLCLTMTGGENCNVVRSEIYFADLAGHENDRTTKVTGENLRELSFINSSLLWLSNCIMSLSSHGKRMSASGAVPTTRTPPPKPTLTSISLPSPSSSPTKRLDLSKFRNSKLTLILANAMTTNSCNALIVTLSPAASHYDTSMSSLKFAVQATGIKLEVKANVHSDPESFIKQLQEEVCKLRERVAGGAATALEADCSSMASELEASKRNEEALRKELQDTRSQLDFERKLRTIFFQLACQRGSEKFEHEYMKGVFAQLERLMELGQVNDTLLAELLGSRRDEAARIAAEAVRI